MTKPIIGITCPWSVETWEAREDGGYYYVGQPYVEAVYKYGGIPMLLVPEYTNESLDSYLASLVDVVDGILFSGGGDVRRKTDDKLPTLRNQQPVRYDFEEALMRKAYEKKIPILGICRGFQMMVEGFGGDLAKETIKGHSQNISGSKPWHAIDIKKDSHLYKHIAREEWNVNSFHIQKVGSVPEGFIVSAKAKDDVIEGIESKESQFLVGYQFHPEELQRSDEAAGNIFKWFLKEAGAKKVRTKI